jgi:hypothetical protein
MTPIRPHPTLTLPFYSLIAKSAPRRQVPLNTIFSSTYPSSRSFLVLTTTHQRLKLTTTTTIAEFQRRTATTMGHLKDSYTLPAAADMHVHLRNAPGGAIARLVTPTIRKAGIDTVFVMPNLAPKPVTTVEEAVKYREALREIVGGEGEVEFLMSLYLHEDVTPEEIKKAKENGVYGVKVGFFFSILIFICRGLMVGVAGCHGEGHEYKRGHGLGMGHS